MKISLHKIDVAERQINQAIKMFFRKDEIISIHTICTSGYQILSDICKKKKIYRQLEDNDILRKLGIVQEVVKSLRKPQNYFKHACKDDNSEINFNTDITEVIIYLAIDLFEKITGTMSNEFKIFCGWFLLKYPNVRNPEMSKAFLKLTSLPNPNDFEFFKSMIKNG